LVQALEEFGGTGAHRPTDVGSIESVVTPFAADAIRPEPAPTLVVLSKARQSTPAFAFQAPLLAVQVNKGMELEGNALIPGAATHPVAQLTDMVWPTVRLPLRSRYRKAVPVPAVMVAEVELVKECVTLPTRTLQGFETEQVAPIVSVVSEVRLAARSVSWLALCAPDAAASSVHVFAVVQPYRFEPACAFDR
jgi:hypothetical protein